MQCWRWRAFDDLEIAACHPYGALAKGTPCIVDAQCTTGYCLREIKGSDTACGLCAPRAPEGGTCYLPPDNPHRGCPRGAACSRGHCLGPLQGEGEPCSAFAWSSNCYGDTMLGRGNMVCAGPAPNESWMGTCQRNPDFQPCVTGQCPRGAAEGQQCGDDAGRECAFPLLCVAGSCALSSPACSPLTQAAVQQ